MPTPNPGNVGGKPPVSGIEGASMQILPTYASSVAAGIALQNF
jgi:hypothetical protein